MIPRCTSAQRNDLAAVCSAGPITFDATAGIAEYKGLLVRLALFGEVFTLLNTADLVGYGDNVANAAEFGQPAARFSHIFGSGGPRAFQFGARVSF